MNAEYVSGAWLACQDIVAGDCLSWTEPVWGGSRACPCMIGSRSIVAIVERDSYGSQLGQHTLSLRVQAAGGMDAPLKGSRILRKARNVYRNQPQRLQWRDETARDARADEKHTRGDAARARRLMLADALLMR